MPIVEQITWYTPEEKMPESSSFVILELKNGNVRGDVEYVDSCAFICTGTMRECPKKNIKLWAYMPKGVGNNNLK